MSTKHFLSMVAIAAIALITITRINTAPTHAQCAPDGTAAADTITCTGTDPNGVTGADGDDTITVDGSDVVNDDVQGGNNNDTITATGNAKITGGDGVIDGQDGNDTITVSGDASINGTLDAIETGSGNNVVTVSGNATLNSSGSDGIETGSGNDVVTITDNAVVHGGDEGIDGSGSNTITVSGNAILTGNNNNAIDGGGGADSIIVTGNARLSSNGDDGIEGDGGNDVVLVNGNAQITAGNGGSNDGIETGSGNDYIAVGGSAVVTGGGNAINSQGGNDTIRIHGTTLTGGNGTAINTGSDDDQVWLESYSNITGQLDGSTHAAGDTLNFAQRVEGDDEANAVRQQISNIQTQINNGAAGPFTITIQGKSYTFLNFEQLGELLQVLDIPLETGGGDGTTPSSGDDNANEVCSGAAKVFRLADGSLQIYTGFNSSTPNGFLVIQLSAAQQTAGSSYTGANGYTVTLDNTGHLVVRDAVGNLGNADCTY